MAIALLLAACGGAAPAPAATLNVPAATADTSTLPPLYGTGVITFGAGYNPDTLAITSPSSKFKTSSKAIAWSASFSDAAGATTVTLILASSSTSGVESIIIKQDVDISDPSFDTLANKIDLALLVGRKAGTYVMRYLRGTTILAEGKFALVK